MKRTLLFLILLFLPTIGGCIPLIAASALGDLDARKTQEQEFKHQEKMEEMKIRREEMLRKPPPAYNPERKRAKFQPPKISVTQATHRSVAVEPGF